MKKLLINGKSRNPELPPMNFELVHSGNGSNPSIILMATNHQGACRGILKISANCKVIDTGYFKAMGFTLDETSFKK